MTNRNACLEIGVWSLEFGVGYLSKYLLAKNKEGIHGQFRVQTTSIFLVLVEVTTAADIGQGFSLVP